MGEPLVGRLPGLGRALRSWRYRGALAVSTDARTQAIADGAARLETLVEALHGTVADIDRRLQDTQALIARTYERHDDWKAAVQAMRAEADYQDAWKPAPLVTVRIATYNNAEVLVERAVASVLRQTYTNWDLVIVGDACTDDTAERVARIADPRIRFENLAERGAYPADERANWYTAGIVPMNRALELARGSWITALDHDDEWDDDHIEVLLAEAQRTRAEVVYGQWRMVDAASERLVNGVFGGEYPPAGGAIAFQSAICHGKLARFHYDLNAHFADEPGDRNLGRRLWEAGVRFAVLRRPVVTYWFAPRAPWARQYRLQVLAARGYADEASEPVAGG